MEVAQQLLVNNPHTSSNWKRAGGRAMYYKVMAAILAFPWLLLALTLIGHLRSRFGRPA